MRMSRVNVYLPDDLAAEAKEAGLNVSSLAQEAIRSALAAESLDTWFSSVSILTAVDVGHEDVLAAVNAAKDELEGV
jgi:post-segregation antitoxin (ccd killing protein)